MPAFCLRFGIYDTPITLSAKEFQLVLYLERNKGLVVTRKQIENSLWQFDNDN